METVELLRNISLLSFTLAGVFAATAVFLFFKLNIRKAVRILSGNSIKKDMKVYKEQRISPKKVSKKINDNDSRKNNFRFREKAAKQLDLQSGTEFLKGGTEFLKGGTEFLKGGTEFLKGGTEFLENGTEFLEGGTEFLKDGTELLETRTELLEGRTELLGTGTELLQHKTETR